MVETRVAVTLDMNVFDAALERIKWLFKEFDGKVCVTSSGGKDSTVVIELAARAARELGYGPVNVWFVDQEAEFDSTINYQRYLAYERDDINFHWYQVPFPMENSMDLENPWFNVWGEGEEWLREKEPTAIKENVYTKPDQIFYHVLDQVRKKDFKGYATLDGMRCEESPNRRIMALSNPQYKWVTWSSNKAQPRFQPIYDWTFRDVWAAIEQNGWNYNKHYDFQYQHGVPVKHMRVSSFTHNQSLNAMLYLQEVEPDLWERATRRLPGLATFGQLKTDQIVRELPYMFESWNEYMHYLIDNLLTDEEARVIFRKQYEKLSNIWDGLWTDDQVSATIASWVILGDHHGIGLKAHMTMARKERKMLNEQGA